MFQPLDGPSAQKKITGITTSTVTEAKAGASRLEGRNVVCLQPSGDIKVYFGDGVNIPNAATITLDGIDHFKNQLISYEAGDKQPIYYVSASGTVSVVNIERA